MIPNAFGLALIAAPGLLAAVALLLRGELRLRLALLAAFALAAAALLAHAPPGPELRAGLAALLMAALGAVAGFALRRWERMPVSVPRDDRHVLLALGKVEPRLFRDLMEVGELRTAEIPLRLTVAGRSPEHLWFVISGELRLEKGGETTHLEGPLFVGEISWLTHAPSTATVIAQPGAEFVEWDRRELRRAARRNPRLRTALEALVARDLARKVAHGRLPAEFADIAAEEASPPAV